MKFSKVFAAALVVAGSCMAGFGIAPARAEYPERPITIIVPFAPGSSNDNLARLLAPYLNKAMNQPIVVQNKPGADALIGIEFMAKSQPDGYTILFSGGAVSLTPALYKTLPWDPIKDIQPISQIGASAYAIAVNPKLPVNTATELVAYAKANPDKLNGAGGGNSSQFALQLFQIRLGTKVQIIPYNGTGEAAIALVSGEADMVIMDAAALVPFQKAGRAKVLAVTSAERIVSMPDIPTTKEAGLDFAPGTFFGIYGPGGMPPAVLQRLNAEINKILALPEIVARLNAIGLDARPVGVEEFTTKYRQDVATWKEVVAKAQLPLK
ncbi:MAG: Bug family tripartite tricarboxylate transporter substrate binding protein [Rhodospirillales bacterium]|jgi:tripartite-type tricarboxylate transporter receptor subunit TctC